MGFTTQLPAAQEYVYVIHATGTNRIKLGFSIRPQERLAQLQTGSPFPLQILACWPSSQEQEQQLHRHFAEFRCVGEWFEVPPFCGLKIYELAAKGGATGSVQAISSAVLEGKRRYRKSGLPVPLDGKNISRKLSKDMPPMPKRIQRRRVVEFQHGMPGMTDYRHGRAFAPTAPEAICKAALLAKLESGEV